MFDPDLRINTPNSFPAYSFNTARQFVRMLIGAWGASRSAWASSASTSERSSGSA
jgi:hypothetical protein